MRLLVLFFTLCFLEIDAGKRAKCAPKCPPIKPEGDYNDPEFLAETINNIVYGLWNNTSPEFSDNGECLKSELLALMNGTDKQRAMAITASSWIWAVLPQYGEGPAFSLCPFAEIVDGTVGFLKNKDCCGLSAALYHASDSIVDASLFAARTALTNSGCAKSRITGTRPSCPGNGEEYQLGALLELAGDDYPKSFKKILERMYNSCDPLDRFLANLTAVSLSAPFQAMITVYDNSLKFQIFTQTLSKKLPKECCGPFVGELKAILDEAEDEAIESAQKALEQFGCH